MSERSVGASPITGNDRPSKAYTRNRLCHELGCATVLSMYNSGKYCYSHEPMVTPRTRGKKIA